MTSTTGLHINLTLLPAGNATPPERPSRTTDVLRRVGSILGRVLRSLSVRNETPSDQAMHGMSPVDRPMR